LLNQGVGAGEADSEGEGEASALFVVVFFFAAGEASVEAVEVFLVVELFFVVDVP
jgi:hypothetical protein